MKMYEKMRVGTSYKHVSEDELKRANKVYERYAKYQRERGVARVESLAEFLLEDVDFHRLDSFLWDKGRLVKTSDGQIGMTTGWGLAGVNRIYFVVHVKTAKGEKSYDADKLEDADVPPEVLEYVKSTLQDKVHGKVDEAFA